MMSLESLVLAYKYPLLTEIQRLFRSVVLELNRLYDSCLLTYLFVSLTDRIPDTARQFAINRVQGNVDQ
jgi:hypothetical protein